MIAKLTIIVNEGAGINPGSRGTLTKPSFEGMLYWLEINFLRRNFI